MFLADIYPSFLLQFSQAAVKFSLVDSQCFSYVSYMLWAFCCEEDVHLGICFREAERRVDYALPSGTKINFEANSYEAFVTFYHPASKYSGPGTDGTIGRDVVITIYPP